MAKFKGIEVPEITEYQKKLVIEDAIDKAGKELLAAYIVCRLEKGLTAVLVEDEMKIAFEITFKKVEFEGVTTITYVD